MQKVLRRTPGVAAVRARFCGLRRSSTIFSGETFDSIRGVSAPTCVALSDVFNFRHMTHVQAAAIPAAMTGEDLFVRAPTGSGKTIAFLVPLVERLRMYNQTFERIKLEKKNQSRQLDSLKHIILDRKSARPAGDLPSTRVLIRGETVDMVDLPYVHTSPAPIGLILVPTRELGQQIASEARRLCELHPGYEVAVFVGGLRIEGDRKKVDYMINGAAKMNMKEKVIICTPGRLLEHLRDTRGFKEICAGIKMMVVDESDRMLDMGFHRDAADILVEIAKAQVSLQKKMEAARKDCEQHLDILREFASDSGVDLTRSRPRLSRLAHYVDDAPDPVLEFDHQTILFSATVSTKVLEIANTILRPGFKYIDTSVDIQKGVAASCESKYSGKEALYSAVRLAEAGDLSSRNATRALIPRLQQRVYCATDRKQLEVLVGVLMDHIRGNSNSYKIIVFAPTSRHAAFLSEFVSALRNVGDSIIVMHSKMTQSKRTRASEDFRARRQVIMFSSDVSARGMDYPDVSMVVQLGLVSRNQYTHRIGRTARAEKTGVGALICTPYELPVLQSDLKGIFADADLVQNAGELQFITKGADLSTGGAGSHIDSTLQRVGALRDTVGSSLGATGQQLHKLAQAAATSWLGFYALECNRLGWGKVDFVDYAKEFCFSMGLKDFPELTPRTIQALKLHDTTLGGMTLKHINKEARISPKSRAGAWPQKISKNNDLWKNTKKLIGNGDGKRR